MRTYPWAAGRPCCSEELCSAVGLSGPLWPGSRLQVPSLRDETVTSEA